MALPGSVAADNTAYLLYTSGSTGQPLGLRQVDPAIGEGAAGELSRLSGPQAADRAKRRFHGRDNRPAPVEMKLGQILASGRVRARKPQSQPRVEQLAFRIAEMAQAGMAGLWEGAGQCNQGLACARPTDPDDGNTCGR